MKKGISLIVIIILVIGGDIWGIGTHKTNEKIIYLECMNDTSNTKEEININHNLEDVGIEIIVTEIYKGDVNLVVRDNEGNIVSVVTGDELKGSSVWLGKLAKGKYYVSTESDENARNVIHFRWSEYAKGYSILFS